MGLGASRLAGHAGQAGRGAARLVGQAGQAGRGAARLAGQAGQAGLAAARLAGRAGVVLVIAGGVAIAQAPKRSLQDGVYTAEQAARGKAAYDAHCAECHMPNLAGHEYAGPLAGDGFQLKWQDAQLSEFLGRVRSMPLGRPGSLGRQEYFDIVAYALQKNGYPEGQEDLGPAAVTGWPPIRIERIRRPPGVR